MKKAKKTRASRAIKADSRTSSQSEDSPNEFGEFLAAARKKKSLTLAEVADYLGLNSGQSIWDWENGKGAGISAGMLLRLIKLYSITEDDAYDQLLRFHQLKTENKVRQKFADAKVLSIRRR